MVWGNGTGIFLFADFLGDLNILSTFRFAPHIKWKGESCFSHTWTPLIPQNLKPLDSFQSLLLPSGYTLNCDTFTIVISNEGTIPLPKTPCFNKARNGLVRARMAEIQDLSHFPFSQNPKQGLARQLFGVTEPRTPIIRTNRSFMSISNMTPVC